MNRTGRKAMVRTAAGRLGTTPWQFRFLHLICCVLFLPLVAATRLPLGKHRARAEHDSIFAETSDEVMVALGIAFAA